MKKSPVALSLILSASIGHADSITHYGAIAGNFASDIPYAQNNTTDEVYDANFGLGLSYGFIYRDDMGPLGGRPIEYGFELGALVGTEDTGSFVPDGCVIDTYLGLNSNCEDIANLESLTYWVDASAMVNFSAPGGATELLAGIGLLHFSNQIDVEHLYETGSEDFYDRDTTFTGAGIKLGARHKITLQNGMMLNLAGFGGVYGGERETDIRGERRDGGDGSLLGSDSLVVTNDATVYVVELRPSINIATEWAGPDGMLEVGISHKQFLSIIDTSGYGDHEGLDLGGDVDDNFSTTSIFAGITFQR